LKIEDYSGKQPENTKKNTLTKLIMMITLIFGAISASKLRRILNLLLMMKSRKQKKHLKSKEVQKR
jgi:hypothetical protein